MQKQVPNDQRKSLNILFKYERTKIIGLRATQLSRGVKPLISFDRYNFKPIEIAKEELKNKLLPYLISRKMPDGSVEIWDIKELRQIN